MASPNQPSKGASTHDTFESHRGALHKELSFDPVNGAVTTHALGAIAPGATLLGTAVPFTAGKKLAFQVTISGPATATLEESTNGGSTWVSSGLPSQALVGGLTHWAFITPTPGITHARLNLTAGNTLGVSKAQVAVQSV